MAARREFDFLAKEAWSDPAISRRVNSHVTELGKSRQRTNEQFIASFRGVEDGPRLAAAVLFRGSAGASKGNRYLLAGVFEQYAQKERKFGKIEIAQSYETTALTLKGKKSK